MSKRSNTASSKLYGHMSVHFDVLHHHIPAELFTTTTNDISKIILDFDRILFANTLKYELVVLPPLAGTFLSRYALRILGGAGLFWAALDTDIGAGFVKGLTGELPAHWAEQAGTVTRQQFNSAIQPVHQLDSEKDENARIESAATEMILAASTSCFLKKTPEQLRKIGLNTNNFRMGFEAKNEFFAACTQAKEVKAIGFTPQADFPIKRKNFPRMQVNLPKKSETEIEHEWQVQIAELKVTSPNWDRKDVRRTWKGKTQQNKECYFRIEDEGFWLQAFQHKLQLDVVDTMKVQWAFIVVDGQPREHQVIKVLDYNGKNLAKPLDENAIEAILGRYRKVPTDNRQNDMFSNELLRGELPQALVKKKSVESASLRLLTRKIQFDE